MNRPGRISLIRMPFQFAIAEFAQISSVLLDVGDQHDLWTITLEKLLADVNEQWTKTAGEGDEIVVFQVLITHHGDPMREPQLVDPGSLRFAQIGDVDAGYFDRKIRADQTVLQGHGNTSLILSVRVQREWRCRKLDQAAGTAKKVRPNRSEFERSPWCPRRQCFR